MLPQGLASLSQPLLPQLYWALQEKCFFRNVNARNIPPPHAFCTFYFFLSIFFFSSFQSPTCMTEGWTKASMVGRSVPTDLEEFWVITQCTSVSQLCWEVSGHSEVSILGIKWQSVLDQWLAFIPSRMIAIFPYYLYCIYFVCVLSYCFLQIVKKKSI